jgi:hypothetical protein
MTVNTILSYVLRVVAVANIIVLLIGASSDRHNASQLVLDWLMLSSLAMVIVFLVSLFFPADKSRKTGKRTDALFALLVVAMLVFMSLSSLPAI